MTEPPEKPKDLSTTQTAETPQRIELQSFSLSTWNYACPPPEAVAKLEALAPGSARRLIDNMIKESEHRREQERKVVDHEIAIAKRGQLFAGLLSLSAMAAAGAGILTGSDWAAITGFVVAIGQIVTAFLVKRSAEK